MISRYKYSGVVLVIIWWACGHTPDYIIPTDATSIQMGQKLFDQHCVTCHTLQQKGIGPALGGITRQVDALWLHDFISDAQSMTDAGDARGQKLYAEYKQHMPPFKQLGDTAIAAILAYLHTTSPRDTTTKMEGLTDPIADTIPMSSVVVTIQDYSRLPASGEKPITRINKMDAASGTGRVFIHDLRGKLYELVKARPKLYLDLAQTIPAFIHQPGLGTGMGSWAFHPLFNENGLFYTTHTEAARTQPADFALPDSLSTAMQWVLTEWQAGIPGSTVFKGTHREILRIDEYSGIHGMQEISFNPRAQPGDSDFGLLYLCQGDGGSVENGHAWIADHHAQRVWSAILRLDPTGRNSNNGQYGIPQTNPWAQDQDPKTLGELYAMGFRNPHRLIWDAQGQLLATDIGHKNIEELNAIIPGGHYGWPHREGTFHLDYRNDMSTVFKLTPADSADPYLSPVLQYDHSEGGAISGGYIINWPSLGDVYICGDIVTGRLFFAPWPFPADGQPAHFQEWRLRYNNEITSLRQICDNNRVDLRFGRDAQGHVYILTKADGQVYRIMNYE